MPEPILAAVDGSQPSMAALDWAADEAALRGLPLRIVHVALTWSYEAPATPDAAAAVPDEAGLRLLDSAAQRVRSRPLAHQAPDVVIETDLLVGPAAANLVSAAQHARMVVLGRRGATGFAGQLLGSVSYQVAAHAPCPVAVIPAGGNGPADRSADADADAARRPEIVLGVDNAQDAADVVAFAFEEAALRGGRLRAVHSWTHGFGASGGNVLPDVAARHGSGPGAVPAGGAAGAVRLLTESLATWREKYRDVEVTQQVERGHAAKVLTDAAAGADLLVVGARGRGGFPRLALGSVTHGVLHHARCPVVVVRPRR